MINAYITDEGVKSIILSIEVKGLGNCSSDEHTLRRSFIEQKSYYANKNLPCEVIGVISGNSAIVTLFDNSTANIYFWKSKKRLSTQWRRANG